MPVYLVGSVVLAYLYPPTKEMLIVFVMTYLLLALGISVGYHRFFSHRSFQANRPLTFFLGLAGGLAGQGAIRRWVHHHRKHHQFTDREGDPHSPQVGGFWWSHVLWRFDPKSYEQENIAREIWKEWPPELVWLDRMIPFLFILHPIALWIFGGWEYVEWACLAPIVLLWNVTFTVNSISHQFGTRYFNTPDESRNSLWLSLLMWGEGWHNNHHAAPKNAGFGMRWYHIDAGYAFIRLMEKIGFARNVVYRPEPIIRSALNQRGKILE